MDVLKELFEQHFHSPAELALQRLHPLDRRVEMLLKKVLENVHEWDQTEDSVSASAIRRLLRLIVHRRDR